MSECSVSGCLTPAHTLVPVDTTNTPGIIFRMRHFCDDHKPPPGTVLQPDDGQLTIDDALGDVIPSRSTDPATSHAAAKEIRVKAGSQRARLLESFVKWEDYGRYANGLTDEEAMGLSPGVTATSEYSKRCSELREGGFIEPTGETRPGSAGPQRIVSRITDKGRRWVSENR